MNKVKTLIEVLAWILSFYIIVILILIGINHHINSKYSSQLVKMEYDNNIGSWLLPEKNENMILQKAGIKKGDNLFIYGSSELSTTDIFTHPNNFFKDKSDGFQVNLIGRGHCQSLIHAINMGSLGKKLKGQKLVFIISPQWFEKDGADNKGFAMNFSESQFYKYMLNDNISKTNKLYLTERVKKLTKNDERLFQDNVFSQLYSYNTFCTDIALDSIKPYYFIRDQFLNIQDEREAVSVMKNKKYLGKDEKAGTKRNFNWDSELKLAENEGKSNATDNDFGAINKYYDTYIKNDLEKDKGMYKNDSYLVSPEYDDLKLFLNTCKDNGIKPLIVSVPVNGRWYDYCEFPKEGRQGCYKKIKDMVESYNFDFLDLSNHEYDKYFLKDIMHLGWKGWVYIDKAIDEYYYSSGK